ncbi:MAG: ABC transporter ATP-binding protein [Alphaproteobacteria bacterium]|nr:ABC transporter ATP-binding protein [Alphaproteobacteria bacterium]
MASVVLDGLTKSYDGGPVVDRVDLAIAHGHLVCLLGPSGCGKTTTLRLIAGFIEPTAGTITVGDRLLSAPGRALPPEQRNMSMIFQSYALWPHMTIAENVAYGLKLRKLDGETIRRKVGAILDVTRLTAFAGRYPGELSGGQQQRVALARALVVEPETLLLDEPLSNLDAALREEMRFELRRLHDAYRYTTVYVTHDQAEAMTTADTIVVMKGGRIEQAGSPEDIYHHPRTEFVARFIGGTNILRGRNLGDARIAAGGLTLRCGQGALSPSGETSVSIRLHDVALTTDAPAGDENVARGRVVRQAFLGAVRDYLVELPGGTQLRAVTPGGQAIAPGADVWLRLPPEHCRALAD